MTGSPLVHRLCGTPQVPGCTPLERTTCWHCAAETERGMPVCDWMGASFVGQNRVRAAHGAHICEACVWVMARSSPVPGRPAKLGKQPPNWRNFSVLVEGDTLVTATKAEKPTVLAFLRRKHERPWLAALADSGQKHVVPYAAINEPGSRGVVQFDEQAIALGDWHLVADATGLLTAGATKGEVARGEYGPRTWIACETAIRDFESRWRGSRASAWFGLAVWLAQRDEEVWRERTMARAAGGGAPRGASGVPRRGRQGPDALGPDPGPAAGRGTHFGVGGAVVHGIGAKPAAIDADQGWLF